MFYIVAPEGSAAITAKEQGGMEDSTTLRRVTYKNTPPGLFSTFVTRKEVWTDHDDRQRW